MGWSITSSFQVVTAGIRTGRHSPRSQYRICRCTLFNADAPLGLRHLSLFKPNKTFDEAKYEKALAENDDRFKEGKIIMDTSYHSMFDEVVRMNNVYNTLSTL